MSHCLARAPISGYIAKISLSGTKADQKGLNAWNTNGIYKSDALKYELLGFWEHSLDIRLPTCKKRNARDRNVRSSFYRQATYRTVVTEDRNDDGRGSEYVTRGERIAMCGGELDGFVGERRFVEDIRLCCNKILREWIVL